MISAAFGITLMGFQSIYKHELKRYTNINRNAEKEKRGEEEKREEGEMV